MEFLAKSNPQILLREHLRHVAGAAQIVAKQFSLPRTKMMAGAALHDIGKAHPNFQKFVRGQIKSSGIRHEIASLLFLSTAPESAWNSIIEMVAAHHHSVKIVEHDITNGRGLLDLCEVGDDLVFQQHSFDWYEWMPGALEELRISGVFPWTERILAPISLEQARESFDYAVNFLEGLGGGISKYRAGLVSADHIASSINDYAPEDIFAPPDYAGKEFLDQRKNKLYPLSLCGGQHPEPHTVVIAPTGAGKTDYLIKRCKGRIFYLLPFQASINAMYLRLKQIFRDTDIRIQHASARHFLRQNHIETEFYAVAGGGIKVMTPHQLFSVVGKLKGYEATIMDIRDCDVILDEIHTYDTTTQAVTVELCKLLKKLGCRIHIGSATLPTALLNEYKKILGEENIRVQTLSKSELASFNRHIVHKLIDEEDGWATLAKKVANNQRVFWVCNTIKSAQEKYSRAKALYPGVTVIIIHSRFRRKDRAALEQRLMSLPKNQAVIVISTQVIEVSLDISFDSMITEAAPIDALLQRFGRVNRERTPYKKLEEVFVLPPADDTTPYKKEIVDKSHALLKDGKVLQEIDVQDMVDAVYDKIELQDIRFFTSTKIKKLRNFRKAAIVELLKIDTVEVVLESDPVWEENKINVSFNYARYNNLRHDSENKVYRVEDSWYGEAGLIKPDSDSFV